MYGKARLAFLFAATLLAAPAFAQSFVGEWTATATTPGGEVSEALSVVKTAGGYAVTAKLIGAAAGTPTAGPGTDVVLDGDRFSYKRTITTPDGDVVFTYAGVVSGDKFTGMAEVAGFQVPYNGVRTKSGG
jgi:hypothetical protein